MKAKIFRITLIMMYIVGFVMCAYALFVGWDYYTLPFIERPHHEMHQQLKPGGPIGHGLGIAGSMMILLLFLYSARKRTKWLMRYGTMSHWLDIHIWFGIMGPLLITLHTSMKFNGIVSISYFSMLAVAGSGFIGRYIYMQIPRDENGMELSISQIDLTISGMEQLLVESFQVSPDLLELGSKKSGGADNKKTSRLMIIAHSIVADLKLPVQLYLLKKKILRKHNDVPPAVASEIMKLIRRRSIMRRRRNILGVAHSVFHLWHVIHKPFAVVMIVIMIGHIVVALLMGSKWIF